MNTPANHPVAYDKYAYIIKNARLVHFVYALGILTWLGVVYGYVIFFQLNRWYWLVFGPMVLLFTLYHLVSYGINLFYRPFDVRKHKAVVKNYWSGKRRPTVDVFLPICGEDPALLAKTFAAVKGIDYDEKTVYVLDDGASSEARELAAQNGFTYLSRPNRGEMKKAGNLKFGHEHSDGEFIVVFDADFAPHADFIRELLPYMADPNVAIVQSPQYFAVDNDVHKRSPLEFGAGQTQEDFYRIIQVSRDRFGGAICVGSNAIYRRSALDEIGGTTQIEHSEDVHTGFNLIAAGFSIKYVPLVLAIGLCPDDMHAYFHQQHRWCSGSMSLLFSRKFHETKLGFGQRLSYWSGFLYYITHALSLLMAFQVFVLLFWHFDQISLVNALPFLPHIVYTFIVIPLFRTTLPKYGSYLVRMAHTYSYSHAVISAATKHTVGWLPTNAKNSVVSRAFSTIVSFNGLYFLTYAALLSVAIATRRFPIFDLNYYSVLFWVFFFVITNAIMLYHNFASMAEIRNDAGWARRTSGAYIVIVALMFTGAVSYRAAHVPAAQAKTLVAVASAQVAEAPAPVLAAPKPSVPETFTVIAAPGDSLTTMYRQAFSDYLVASDRTVDAARRVYVEDSLVKMHYRPIVYVGDVVTAKTSEMESLAGHSMGLTDAQVANLKFYAALAGMRDDATLSLK